MIKNEQINLKYIADEFGVSVSTISRAIHDLPGVRKELKERILQRIDELQFRTNIIARSLKTGKFNVLGVIVPDNSQIYFARIIKGIEDTAKKRDYSVIVMNTDRDIKNEVKCISILNALSVAGILAAPIDESNYLNTSISVMILSNRGNNYTNKDFDYVINDDFRGAYIATEHLIKKNYNLIFFLGPVQKFLTSKKRLAGYKKALEDYNIGFNENMVINIDGLSFEDGYDAIKKINRFPDQPFSFFCINDDVAIGAMKALKEKNLKIPSDTGVVGYDDIEILKYLDTPITTIRQSRYKIGHIGAEYLIDKIENKNTKTGKCRIALEPVLIERDST